MKYMPLQGGAQQTNEGDKDVLRLVISLDCEE
jgi:hypothetical protein